MEIEEEEEQKAESSFFLAYRCGLANTIVAIWWLRLSSSPHAMLTLGTMALWPVTLGKVDPALATSRMVNLTRERRGSGRQRIWEDKRKGIPVTDVEVDGR